MDHQGRRHVGLAETDAVAEHGAAEILEHRDDALGCLPLVGGLLVTLGRRVQSAAFAQHLADHLPETELRLLGGCAFVERLDASARAREVHGGVLPRCTVPMAVRFGGGGRARRVPMSPPVPGPDVAQHQVGNRVEQQRLECFRRKVQVDGDDDVRGRGHQRHGEAVLGRGQEVGTVGRGEVVEPPMPVVRKELPQVVFELGDGRHHVPCEVVETVPPLAGQSAEGARCRRRAEPGGGRTGRVGPFARDPKGIAVFADDGQSLPTRSLDRPCQQRSGRAFQAKPGRPQTAGA